MHQSISTGCSIPDFCLKYGDYLFRVRGLSASTRKLHRHVVCRFLTSRFPDGKIIGSELRFSDLVDFLKQEFSRLSSRDTQRAWLMILRSVLRYLSEAGQVPKGWEGALPKVANRSHARLPKNLSKEQVEALRAACRGEKPRHFRNRALLLLFLRLGLRVQEVSGLTPSDIDWKNGYLKIRCTKVNGQSAVSVDLRNEVWQVAKCCSASYDGAPFEEISRQKRRSFREPTRRDLLHKYLRQVAWVRLDPLDISEVAEAGRYSVGSWAASAVASFV